ncbi:hypothetical protein ACO0LF_15825 [Undibacterium sp. Di27W]|uniref:hypothetical protein n=1 Tax=Undibacterium sp. Di27W TaxID=3413036 RepID=UPI003BF29182
MLTLKQLAAIASIIFLGNFYPAAGFAKPPQEQLLVGKWMHSHQIQTDDGRVIPQKKTSIEDTGIKATGEFFTDNTWVLNGRKVRSSGTYRWVDSEHIEQKVLESNVAIQVGMLSIKRIRVSENRLEFIVTHDRAEMERYLGPVKPGQKRPNETIITSVFTRVGTGNP